MNGLKMLTHSLTGMIVQGESIEKKVSKDGGTNPNPNCPMVGRNFAQQFFHDSERNSRREVCVFLEKQG